MPSAKWFLRGASLATIALGIGSSSPCARSQQVLTRIRLDAPVATAAISTDGRLVAANIGQSVQHPDGRWTNSEAVEVFDPSALKVIAKIQIPVSGWSVSPPSPNGFVSYCDSGRYLAVYDRFTTLYVLDSKSYLVQRTIDLGNLPTHGALGTRRIVCSSQASILVINDAGGNYGWGHLSVYDLESGSLLSEIRQDSQSGVEFGAVSIAPNGSRLAVLLENPRGKRIEGPDIEIRNATDLKPVGDVSTGDVPWDIGFAGNLELVTVPRTSYLRPSKNVLGLWSIETGKELRQFSDSQFDVNWPISASADGQKITAAATKYSECHLCNGLERRIDVKEQRFAVWDTSTGAQFFRSEPLSPIIEPLGARCVLSQDGSAVLIYWPESDLTPRIVHIPGH